MFRLARPSLRIICCLLGMLLLAQLGFMQLARAAQPQWLEVCSAGGTSYIAVTDQSSALQGHHDDAHCPACPIGQAAALLPTPAELVFKAELSGSAPPLPQPFLCVAPAWRPSLPRGPPLLPA
jgi:hypothetical protein